MRLDFVQKSVIGFVSPLLARGRHCWARGRLHARLCRVTVVGNGYFGEFDDLSAAEAELLVVVEHRVHVLDPDGVDRSVKHVPALVVVRR